MFISVLLLLLLCDKLQCSTFNCKFFIDPKSINFPDRIGCIAEIESYEGDDLKLASFDSTAVMKYSSSGKNGDASPLMKFIESKPMTEITEVVRIHGHRFETHPQNVGLIFPNITTFTLSDGKLWRLRKEDLRQFPNQIELNYYDNKIQYLETDLFIYNPFLRTINLSKNEIMQVSQMLGISKHYYLGRLMLDENLCTDKSYNCDVTVYNCTSAKATFMLITMKDDCPEIETQILTNVKSNISTIYTNVTEVQKKRSENLTSLRKFETQLSQMSKDLSQLQTLMHTEAKKTKEIESNIIKGNENIANFNYTILRVHRIISLVIDDATHQNT